MSVRDSRCSLCLITESWARGRDRQTWAARPPRTRRDAPGASLGYSTLEQNPGSGGLGLRVWSEGRRVS
jgi:hypothetical protein